MGWAYNPEKGTVGYVWDKDVGGTWSEAWAEAGDAVSTNIDDISGVTAAGDAADIQRDALEAATARQEAALADAQGYYDTASGYYDPYQEAGAGATDALSALTGGAGSAAQAEAMAALEASPLFQGLSGQGETAILQNAAATGGLRGGNTQGALAQYRPQLLQSIIQQQVGNLSGLAGMGLSGSQGAAGIEAARANAALGVGSDLADYDISGGNIDASERLAEYDLTRGFYEDILGGAASLATGIPVTGGGYNPSMLPPAAPTFNPGAGGGGGAGPTVGVF